MVEDAPIRPRATPSNGTVDTESQEAFPSLAPAPQAANRPVASAWGASAGPRIKPAASKQPVVSDTFTISSVDLSTAGKDGKPTSLGEISRQVMAQYKVKLDSSTNQKSRQTTFFLKADSKKELDKAKKSLLALLSPVVRSLPIAPFHESRIGPHMRAGGGRSVWDDLRDDLQRFCLPSARVKRSLG